MLNRLQARRGEEGFTLIELLVVIIIIGILAAIAIPVFLNQRKKGWEAAVQADLRNAATAEETVLTERGYYVPDGTVVTTSADAMTLLATPGGFKQSPAANYDATDNVITAVADAGNGYCLYAHSASGAWFWYDSAAGPGKADSAPDVTTDPGQCQAPAAP